MQKADEGALASWLRGNFAIRIKANKTVSIRFDGLDELQRDGGYRYAVVSLGRIGLLLPG